MVNQVAQEEKEPEAPNWLIENIAEASKIARKFFLFYMAFLAYCALTTVGTTDRQIILNETTHLPILNIEVSVAGFFLLAPLISILLFVYLQLYVHRIKSMTDDLRNNYPQIELRRLYPWMVNIAEDPEPGTVGKLQKTAVVLCHFWFLPLVLTLIAFWCIKKHDIGLSIFVSLLPIIGTFVVLWFWRQFVSVGVTIRRKQTQASLSYTMATFLIILFFGVFLYTKFQSIGLSLPLSDHIMLLSAILALVLLVGFVVSDKTWENKGGLCLVSVLLINMVMTIWVIPIAMEGNRLKPGFLLKEFIFIDLRRQTLASDPGVEYEYIHRVDLSDVHLEGANLWGANLHRAYLLGSHLNGARLDLAVLREANLFKAQLSFATLGCTDLRRTDLSFANFQGADLRGANLEGAILIGTDFRDADLRDTKGLSLATLQITSTLYGAKLDSTIMVQIRESCPYLLEPEPQDMSRFLEH